MTETDLKSMLERIVAAPARIAGTRDAKAKVRHDGSYWKQIEIHISRYSDSQFSHSISPGRRDGVVKNQLDGWRERR